MRRNRETQQLDLNYRGSKLSCSKLAHTAMLCAGDRAPDAPCCNIMGGSTSIFQLLQGPHWTLFGYETGDTTFQTNVDLCVYKIGNEGDIVDTYHHIRDAYQLNPGEWILIRPDGYIAAITPAQHLADLTKYLAEHIGIDAHE